jgi:hypothetical protein
LLQSNLCFILGPFHVQSPIFIYAQVFYLKDKESRLVVFLGGRGEKNHFFGKKKQKWIFQYEKGVNLTKISKIMENFTIIL